MSTILLPSPPDDIEVTPLEDGGFMIAPTPKDPDGPIRVNGGPGNDIIIIGSCIPITIFNITADIALVINTGDDDLIGDVVGAAIGTAIGTALGNLVNVGPVVGAEVGTAIGIAIADFIGNLFGGAFSNAIEASSRSIVSLNSTDEDLNIEEIIAGLDIDGAIQSIDVLEILQTLDIEDSLEGITLEELAQQVQGTLDNLDTDQLVQDLDIPAIESNIAQLEAAVNVALEATALVNTIANTPDIEPTDLLVPAREAVNAFDNAITLFQEQGIDSSLLEEQRTLLANAIGGQASGLGGDDTITGGDGYDIILGISGDDSLMGGGSDDTIRGDEGNDTISGDTGDDSISGGLGEDFLTGGEGADTFVFEEITPGEIDTITDFTPGEDKIQLPLEEDTLLEFFAGNPDEAPEGTNVIYNPETGLVTYNPDGEVGTGDEIDFLLLEENLELGDDDFEFL